MAQITCSQCGGIFDSNEPKCPYCGFINEAGAEQEYSEKLEEIRTDLDVVDNIAEDNFKSEIKDFFRAFVRTALVVLLLFLLIEGINAILKTGDISIERTETVAEIAKVKEFYYLTKEWNELFEKGKYDELVERVETEKKPYSSYIYYWKHSKFVQVYEMTVEAQNQVDEFLNSTYVSSYKYTSALHAAFYAYYKLNDSNTSEPITEDEIDILNRRLDDTMQYICDKYEITEEDYLALHKEATKSGYPSYDVLDAFAKERLGE